MSGIPAVFVDGAANMREMVLERLTHTYRFPVVNTAAHWFKDSPVDQAGTEFSVAEFERLGRLPDGRHVYVQAGYGWKLWDVQAMVSELLVPAARNAVRAQLQHQALEISTGPVVVLCHQETPTGDGMVVYRRMGVAKPKDIH